MVEGGKVKESIPRGRSQSQPSKGLIHILMPTDDSFAYKHRGYFQLVSTQSTADYSAHRLASDRPAHHDRAQQQYGYYG